MGKVIRLDGEIGWEIRAEDVAKAIEGQDEVTLILNSPGGSILEGFAIYNILADFDGKIVAKIDLAASMMSVIAMAADEIEMKSDSSMMMIHKPWSGGVGESQDLRKIADTLDKLEDMIVSIYMTKAKIKEPELREMLANETYLSGKDALDIGFATKVVSGKSKNMLGVALSAMSAREVKFDNQKFAAKIKEIESGVNLKAKIEECEKLSELDSIIRGLGASQSEATAIVAQAKKLSYGDRIGDDEKTAALVATLKSFKI